jgi:protein phosphatase
MSPPAPPSHAALTHRGRVREANEDAYAARPELGLYLVTDGVGGEGNGAAAARIVAQEFPRILTNSSSSRGSQIVADAKKVIANAVRELHHRTRAERGPGKTQATIVAAVLQADRALVAHLGDSRAYLFRAGELTRLTKDHSLGQLLIDAGEMQPNELENSPHRSKITRCIGMVGDPLPEFREFDWRADDILVLCSDGLTSMLSDDVIQHVLSDGNDPAAIVNELIDLANKAGGFDNITVVVVRHEPNRPAA